MPSATLRSTRLLAIVAAIAIVLATLAVGLVAAPPADAAQPVPGHTGLVPEHAPDQHAPDQQRRDLGHRGRRHTASSSPARSPRIQNTTGNTAIVNQRVPGVVQLEHRAGRHRVPADLRRRRGRRRRGLAGRHQAVRRRHLQHRQRRHQAQDRLAQPRPPAPRWPASPPTPTPRSPRWPPPTRRSTSAAGSPRSTAPPAWAWPPSTAPPARSAPASSTTSPAASASTACSPCSSSSSPMTRTKLLVVHTGRQIAGQDRYGVGMISTRDQPAAALAHHACGRTTCSSSAASSAPTAATSPPTTSTSWSPAAPAATARRSTTPPIAFPVTPANEQRPAAVGLPPLRQRLLGGHHRAGRLRRRALRLEESPTAPDPWPGLDDVGYGTGQGLSGYGLGDAVVRRDHIGALNPADGKALEWNPGSNSFEGNKAMEATARGLFVGGDGSTQGGNNIGRVAFYDFNSVPAQQRRSRPRSPTRSRAASTPVRRAVRDQGHGHRGRRRQPGPGRDPGPQHQAVPRRTT